MKPPKYIRNILYLGLWLFLAMVIISMLATFMS
jgi:hypothetical protein